MKIAILTYSREANCGAVLQAWALKKVIERLGHKVDMPVIGGYETKGRWHSIVMSMSSGPASFVKNLIYQCFTLGIKEWVESRFKKAIDNIFAQQRLTTEELSGYDLIVVGSDQVWNPDMGVYKLPLYLGEVIPKNVPLVGYAVSAGDVVPEKKFDSRFAKAMNRFSRVFVRERLTGDFLCRASGCQCEQVLDPSLLLPIDQYGELEEGVVPFEPYVFFYVLATNDVVRLVPSILKAVGVTRAVFYDGSIDFVPHRKPQGYRRFVSPGEYVRLARRATAIVACSFHGTAFALLSQKPFIALTPKPAEKKYDTRAGDLLLSLGCEERMFSVNEPIERLCAAVMKPLDDKVLEELSELRQKSIDLLKTAINSGDAQITQRN